MNQILLAAVLRLLLLLVVCKILLQVHPMIKLTAVAAAAAAGDWKRPVVMMVASK